MTKPFVSNIQKNPYLHTGAHLFSFLATGEQTQGKFGLMHVIIRRGFEPPAHTHTRENEAYYLLAGEMEFVVGGEKYKLAKGDFIYLPKDISHSWICITETAQVLIWVEPAGIEQFFIDQSEPISEFKLPEAPTAPPPPEFMNQFIHSLTEEYGVIIS
jgi:quercetin dioxygenase-like cupin family protein